MNAYTSSRAPSPTPSVFSRLRRLIDRLWLATPSTRSTIDIEFAKPHQLLLNVDTWVECLDGVAWVTRDGSLDDIILSPGDIVFLSRIDDPLVVGMPRCRLLLAPRRDQAAAESESRKRSVQPADD